jgi:dTDP-4-dehydrorhamnose reductase
LTCGEALFAGAGIRGVSAVAQFRCCGAAPRPVTQKAPARGVLGPARARFSGRASMSKRVLILGGGGMLGHKLWQEFRDRYDCHVTVRGDPARYAPLGLFDASRMLGRVSALDFDTVVQALLQARPEVVVNGIGVVKCAEAEVDRADSLSINATFPHWLAQRCRAAGTRLIHISTDCVFSGRTGGYDEASPADAEDLYGQSKHLGEVARAGCLTIRTSLLGRELSRSRGLVEWFLGHRGGRVRGFRKAVFSGLTTIVLADVLATIIDRHPELEGVWHVASEPICKYDLLLRLNEAFGLGIEILPDDALVCDRSLDGSRFRASTRWIPPDWPSMIHRMRADPTPYDAWRARSVA